MTEFKFQLKKESKEVGRVIEIIELCGKGDKRGVDANNKAGVVKN